MSFSFSSIILFFSSMSTSYFLLHSDNSTFNSALNQRRNRRRSCFVGEFEKKLSKQSFGIFTQQTFCWYYWRIMQWYVRHRETESSERFFAPAMGPERGLQSRKCNRVIRPMICRKERLSLILLLAKGLCIKWHQRRRRVWTGWCRKQSICWCWRCLRKCYCNKTISARKRTVDENRFGTDFNIFPDLPHFLGYIKKGRANFLIDN